MLVRALIESKLVLPDLAVGTYHFSIQAHYRTRNRRMRPYFCRCTFLQWTCNNFHLITRYWSKKVLAEKVGYQKER